MCFIIIYMFDWRSVLCLVRDIIDERRVAQWTTVDGILGTHQSERSFLLCTESGLYTENIERLNRWGYNVSEPHSTSEKTCYIIDWNRDDPPGTWTFTGPPGPEGHTAITRMPSSDEVPLQ